MKLRKDIGKLQVKSLGIVLTSESTPEEIARAIKHQPSIEQFIEKGKSDGSKKDPK